MKQFNLQITGFEKENYPYGIKCIQLDPEDDVLKYYAKGYLVTFIRESTKSRPVLCVYRSIRIDLDHFDYTSENRRILKKTDFLKLFAQEIGEFKYDPIKVGKFSLDNFRKRGIKMHISKIKRIYTEGINNQILTYKDLDKVVGYATVIVGKNSMHYTFPFYDVEYYKKNLGLGMMLRAIIWAKQKKMNYIYLGTCNQEKAFYKLQFKGVEWFNGNDWSKDIKELKSIIRRKDG